MGIVRTLGLAFIVLFSGCENEILIESQDSELRVVEGRVFFSSKENLRGFMSRAKEEPLEFLHEKLVKLEQRGFVSLMPTFRPTDETKKEEYAARMKRRKSYFGREIGEEIDAMDNPIIADPHFASILNEDGEIQVNDFVYRYTEIGLFYTSTANYPVMDDVIGRIDPCQMQATSRDGLLLDDGVYGFVPRPIDCGGGGGCTNCGGSTGTTQIAQTRDQIIQNLKICEWDPNIWDDIFGPAQKCQDYFEDDKRIKVKTWSQNYGLFASSGVKVESQNRLFRVWWAEKIDEVELGYTLTSFEYDIPEAKWPTNFGAADFHFEHNGFIIDQYGQYVSTLDPSPRKLFSNFPINDPEQEVVKIYALRPITHLFNQYPITITGKEFNDYVQSIVKQAYKKLSESLRKEFTSKNAVITYVSADAKKITFLYLNWNKVKLNENKIVNTFDWNSATIGFKSTGYQSPSINQFDISRSYKRFQSVCYGMGRRGSVWRGGKIVLDDSK
jgi:hypothetical protein